MQKWAQKQAGFTIVELLIVIVVIAILAAITIVAYNGIRQSTERSALMADLSQQAKKLQSWNVTNGDVFPGTLSDARTAGILVDSTNVTYVEYMTSPDNRNYCATASRTNGLVFSVTSVQSTPMPGRCVENLITNPSFETNTVGWTTGGASPSVARASGSEHGSMRLVLTKASPVSDSQLNTLGPLSSATPYSVIFWASSSTTTCAITAHLARNNTAYSTFIAISKTLTTEPQLQRATGTSPADSTQFRLRMTPCQDGTSTVYYDGFTVVRGNYQLKTTYDGTSPGWFWTGDPHNSTSIGPAEVL